MHSKSDIQKRLYWMKKKKRTPDPLASSGFWRNADWRFFSLRHKLGQRTNDLRGRLLEAWDQVADFGN